MNILVAAVGGQGALLAARVIGNYAMLQSRQVKVSEIHGMSQRGGSVVTHIRYASEVYSPVIEIGTADVLLGFEILEAARSIQYLRPGGMLVVSKQQIQPLPVLTGAATYPPALLESFARLPITTYAIDAHCHASQLGNIKAVNTLLVGVLARRLSDDPAPWQQAIAESVPARHRELNRQAFDFGFNFDFSSVDSRRHQQKGAVS
jgi:indolepyruvate ferredoxin oxidoreductase beta subunit